MYTTRKLEDWVSNAIYRWRSKMRKRPPASWASRAAGVRPPCAIDESGLDPHLDTQCSSACLRPMIRRPLPRRRPLREPRKGPQNTVQVRAGVLAGFKLI